MTKSKPWIRKAKWYLAYIATVGVGFVLGSLQDRKYGTEIFGIYFTAALLFHACFPYLVLDPPATKAQALWYRIPKIIFPFMSLMGWGIMWWVYFNVR